METPPCFLFFFFSSHAAFVTRMLPSWLTDNGMWSSDSGKVDPRYCCGCRVTASKAASIGNKIPHRVRGCFDFQSGFSVCLSRYIHGKGGTEPALLKCNIPCFGLVLIPFLIPCCRDNGVPLSSATSLVSLQSHCETIGRPEQQIGTGHIHTVLRSFCLRQRYFA